jgi:hypothetical protein
VLVVPLLLAAIGPDPSVRQERPVPEEVSEWEFSFRVSAGGEWDTNATRSIEGAGGDVVSDGLVRLVVDTRVRFDPAPGHQISAGYLLGAKRFFREQTEDLLVHNLNLSSGHVLVPWLIASIVGAGKMSRIRNGTRDYNLGYVDGALTFRPLGQLDLEAHGGISGFTFPAEPNYDYLSPRVGGALTYRPIRGLSLTGGFDWVWRRYDGNALVRTTENMLSFCMPEEQERNICVPAGKRRDTEAQISINATYRGSFVVGGGYLLRLQRSNSDLEQVDRHRISAFGTVGLPFDFTLNLLAALQINNGVSITDTLFLAEDDENQNSVQAGIGYRIVGDLVAELRYALFANQFATNDVSFLRHTVYLGLGYRAGQ